MPRKEIVSNEPVYTIGIAARKLQVSVHALRLYEREGLIHPFRTETNRRLYSDVELRKVECIKQMIRERGLNFEGIRRLYGLVPCYRIKKCPREVRETCAAYTDRTRPCWSAKVSCAADPNLCRECSVYTGILSCDDVQRLILSS
jgi:MerR family transcriptional regulator/heat shock protein HspR